MTNDPDLLGYTAEDKITGFRGTVTAVVRYISGCVQACISPKVDADGKEKPSMFFDVQRIRVLSEFPRLILDNHATPGNDRPPSERPAPPARTI